MTGKSRFIVKTARGAPDIGRDLLTLQEVLDDCPMDHQLHSVVPIASGGGYTLYLKVIFERIK